LEHKSDSFKAALSLNTDMRILFKIRLRRTRICHFCFRSKNMVLL